MLVHVANCLRAYAIINTKHILHITEKRRNMYLKYSDLFAAVEIAVGFA